jgi:imidazolonepropionase
MQTLIINIKELLQVRETPLDKVSGNEMAILPTIKNAYLLIENDLIAAFGPMENCPKINADNSIDATGKMILPSWCDSHTHIVYVGNREQEFVDRINGLTYEEIANRGGGILNSAKKLNEASELEIYNQSKKRLEEVITQGTGAVEIKSGYGLTVDGELKMLRVIKKLAENYAITIKATFLGAHAFPLSYKENHEGYIDLLINEMLPKIAEENLADYIDVFCERNYFSVAEMEEILLAGMKAGLKPKVHVNQFSSMGGLQKAIELNALSVDHLEELTELDISTLKSGASIPVFLPGCSHFLSIPFGDVKKLVQENIPFALASDFNPGSTPCYNLCVIWSLACIKMRLTPEEALSALTINAAAAMELSATHGTISLGKKPGIILTKEIPN